MRQLRLIAALLIFPLSASAADTCMVIHGRAHYYAGDANLRIWHIGTHHEYEPDTTTFTRVMAWLTEGTTKGDLKRFASPESNLMLYGDFTVCPTEPFRQGSAQHAKIISLKNRTYVRLEK
jgi:hypothetical protein